MRNILLLLTVLLAPAIVFAQYKPVEQGSTLTFAIKNLGVNVNGSFTGVDGTINFDLQNIGTSNFDVTINAATVNTDNVLRDEHLKGESYFDVQNYPRIRLASTQITGKNGSYVFTGNLTIKGKSKILSFPFTASVVANGLVFKGSFKMNRRYFAIGGASTIADELQVNLNIIAKK